MEKKRKKTDDTNAHQVTEIIGFHSPLCKCEHVHCFTLAEDIVF